MNYAATRNANPQPLGNVIVAKFGGTSVADFDAMNRSADIVLSRPEVRLVVLRLCGRHQFISRAGRR